jgi:hypothetical protein
MTDLKQMIADQQALKAARDATYTAHFEADERYREGSKRLTEALIEASGRKVGDEFRTTDGRDARIYHFLQTDNGKLTAICHGKTKAGKWSSVIKFTVNFPIKELS